MLDNKIEEHDFVETGHGVEVEHHEKVVEDIGARRRQDVSRFIQLIWLMFGVLEATIGLRFFLKLIAANPSNPFARLVYNFTNLFLWPFAGLTISPSANGMVLEIPAVIAMLVYALLGWVLASLVWIIFARSSTRKVMLYERRKE